MYALAIVREFEKLQNKIPKKITSLLIYIEDQDLRSVSISISVPKNKKIKINKYMNKQIIDK